MAQVIQMPIPNLRPNQGSKPPPIPHTEAFPELSHPPKTLVTLKSKAKKMEKLDINNRERKSQKGGKRSPSSSPSASRAKVTNNTAADRDRSPGDTGEQGMERD